MADRGSDFIGGLVTGAVIGGVVGGVLGTVLTQRLRAPSTAGSRKRAYRRHLTSKAKHRLDQPQLSDAPEQLLEEMRHDAEEVIAAARDSLEDKISQLNSAIESTRSQLIGDASES